jgi:hypothetical protein
MNNDPLGRTPGAIHDEAKHFYAVGTVRVRAIADEISEIAQKGDRISLLERKRLHAQLVNVYELTRSQTVFGMDNEDTFSDGTPVTIVAGPPSSRGCSAPSNEHSCEIPWLPNIFGNDGYDPEGPIPPGCEVIVVAPPHQRKSTARAARQDAYSDSEALKTRLRELKTRLGAER